MRALVFLLALAACAPPAPANPNRPMVIPGDLDDPQRQPQDSVAAMGAQAMCSEGAHAVTDRSDGIAVSSCVADESP